MEPGVRTRGTVLVALTSALALIADEPHPGWYAIPEVICDATTRDEDQWRCDEEPVTFQRGSVAHSTAETLQPAKTAPD
jgi:hypothetical protein